MSKMVNKYKVVIFDLDGTLYDKPWESNDEHLAVSTWDVLFQTLGIYDVHQRLKNVWIRGGFKSLIEWGEAACCVLKVRGLDRKTFEDVINSRPLMPGAVETLKILKEHDIITGIVSGSFEALALRAQRELGIDHVLATAHFKFDANGFLSSWKIFPTDYKDKVKFVKYLADLNKVSLDKVAYVGDDVNDIPVFKKVGLAIAFNCTKQKVMENAHVVIKEKDLRKILPYLGIKE
jgi:phosphoserine phosphatase